MTETVTRADLVERLRERCIEAEDLLLKAQEALFSYVPDNPGDVHLVACDIAGYGHKWDGPSEVAFDLSALSTPEGRDLDQTHVGVQEKVTPTFELNEAKTLLRILDEAQGQGWGGVRDFDCAYMELKSAIAQRVGDRTESLGSLEPLSPNPTAEEAG